MADVSAAGSPHEADQSELLKELVRTPPDRQAVRAARARERRRMRRRARRSSRLERNHYGHRPGAPRCLRPKGKEPHFLGPARELARRAYDVRDTVEDPRPAPLLRYAAGKVRQARIDGVPIPMAPRKRKNSQFSERDLIFEQFILRHLDLDSHLVGWPDGHYIVPYSLDGMLREIREHLAETYSAEDDGPPPEYFSKRTLSRVIQDWCARGWIYRWQPLELVTDVSGEDEWQGFNANLRVLEPYFLAAGYARQQLINEREWRREQRGFTTREAPPTRDAGPYARDRKRSSGYDRVPLPGRLHPSRAPLTGHLGVLLERLDLDDRHPDPNLVGEASKQLRLQVPAWNDHASLHKVATNVVRRKHRARPPPGS